MAEDLSSVVQAWVPRHGMCVLRHRMWVPRHDTPCRPTRPQGWDAPQKLRERWCHPLTYPLLRGERASLEASPPRLRCLYRIWGTRRTMREIAGARPTRPDRATRRRRVRDGRATRQHRVALHFLTTAHMSAFVPLGGAECAIRVPIGSIEWHAPEAVREEGLPRTAARWPWATLKPWPNRPSRQAYALILQ